MKLGILADIHEDVEGLRQGLALMHREAVDCLVVLGDVFETGRRIGETVALLADAGVVGVWGNHDLGLCHQPDEEVQVRYAGPVLEFMQTLRPRLDLEDCLFTHALPCWDPTDPIVYYLGPRPETDEGRADAFAATTCRINFMGHFHRWLAATPEGRLPWDGGPLPLEAGRRHLVVVAAVCDGWCATYDTVEGRLVPWQLREGARRGLWAVRGVE